MHFGQQQSLIASESGGLTSREQLSPRSTSPARDQARLDRGEDVETGGGSGPAHTNMLIP
jgi:hypothetical protein